MSEFFTLILLGVIIAIGAYELGKQAGFVEACKFRRFGVEPEDWLADEPKNSAG